MIFYFSGTGNTRWAAESLAHATCEQAIFIPDALTGDCHYMLNADERIGFCFPVHGWRPPNIVRKFISRLTFSACKAGDAVTNHYCYALITAGDTIGKTAEIFENDLNERGISTSAVCTLIMPESYVGLPTMDVDTPEKEIQKKEAARLQLADFTEAVQERRKGYYHLVKGPVPAFFSGPVGGFFIRHIISDRPFHVESSRCVKCGICADVCPVHDIKGGVGYEPQWLHKDSCLSCFACYHHCPHHAIEYGMRTKHKGQYFFERKKR